MLIGLIFGFWSVFTQVFQARGTPLPMMPTQKLLITGPFRLCRNPMSFGTILVYLGISIIVGSISALATALIFTILLVVYIKAIEERELEARFGDEYIEYKSRTPFLIPRLFRKRM
jgi:protein-S-isoprenylcysteine O-methyltransferase Ste14